MHAIFGGLVLHFQQAESLVHDILDEKFHRAIPEISVYLKEGIGNHTRIDYGTGHYFIICFTTSQSVFCSLFYCVSS